MRRRYLLAARVHVGSTISSLLGRHALQQVGTEPPDGRRISQVLYFEPDTLRVTVKEPDGSETDMQVSITVKRTK